MPLLRPLLARVLTRLAGLGFGQLSTGMAIVVCVGLLVPALIGGGVITTLRQERLDAAMQQQLADKIELLAGSLAVPVWNYDLNTARTIADSFLADPQVVRVTLTNREHLPLIARERPERRLGVSRTAHQELLLQGSPLGQVEIEINDGLRQGEYARDRRADVMILLGQFAATLLLILFALRFWVLKPLARLTRFSDQLAGGDLSQPLTWQRPDEIGRLAQQLEQMRGALRALFVEQRAILDNVEVGVLFVRDGRVEQANRHAELIFGYAAGDMPGLAVETLALPPGSAAYGATVTDGRDGGGPPPDELRIRRHDGSSFWASVRASVLDPAVPQAGSIWAIVDVTERRLVQMRLTENQMLLKTLMHALPDLIWLKNPQGVYLACNQRFERFFGASEQGIAGKTDYDFVDRELADHFRAHDLKAVEKGGSSRNEEWVTFASDGHRELLETTKTPIFDADRRLLGVLGIGHDITERKRAEEALRESERRYRMIFQTNLALITVTHLDDGTFVDANQAYLDAFGYAYDEIIGRRSLDLDIWTDLAARQIFAETLRRDGKIQNFESRFRKRNGETMWGLMSASLIEFGGVPCIQGVLHDITAYKAAESELAEYRLHLEQLVATRTADLDAANRSLTLARDAAEAANRAKSAFLANMSHEIRTPMNAILGITNILRRSGVSAQQAEHLDKIGAASEHLLATINDILDVSKIEAGKLVLEEAPVSISGLIDKVSSLLGDRAHAKGLELCVDCADFPAVLYGDPTRLQQALLNYTSNAVKFTDAGYITLRALVEAADDDAIVVRFEVNDSGVGIPAEVLPRLFSAFEQADNSTTRKYGGTGLGLAITHRLAGLMGGETGATSTLGVGSTFWFTARLRRKAVAIEPDATTDDARATTPDSAERLIGERHRATRVLLVDDEPVNLEIARFLLEDAGLRIDTAADGAAAVACAAQTTYALILMDMQMPELDGIEATRRIRSLPGYDTTPIIAMTANAFAEDKARCLAAGMDDFLVKPVKPERLFSLLLDWLEKRDGL